MKNIIVVSKQGCALAVQGNTVISSKSAQGHFIANLEVIKEVLLTVPESTNLTETTHIMISDVVQGLVSGGAIEYIKTGKTAGGNQLSAEEVALFKEVYSLYASRLLNVKFSQHKYVKTTDVENQALKKFAYDELNKYIATNGVVNTNNVATTTVVDPDKELREMFDAQIKEAMIAKDMAQVKELMEMRNGLRTPETVTTNTSVATNTTTATQFDKNSLLEALKKEVENDEGDEDLKELGDNPEGTQEFAEGKPEW